MRTSPVWTALGQIVMLLGLAGFMGIGEVPDLIEGIPTNDTKTIDSRFAARVLEAFPPGMTVEEIIDELEDDGFTVNARAGYAVFTEYSVACKRNWMVRWSRRAGTVLLAEGKTGLICL